MNNLTLKELTSPLPFFPTSEHGLFRNRLDLEENPIDPDGMIFSYPDPSSSDDSEGGEKTGDFIEPLLPPQINYDKVGQYGYVSNDTYFFQKFYFYPSFSNILLLIALVLFTLWVVVMNTLTIIGLWKTHRTGHMADLYLANLAVGDTLLGILILPLMSVVILIGYFPFGRFVCDMWVFLDYYLIVASSFGNCALMCNYLWMIRWPSTFPVDFKHHILALVLTWICVNVAWTPPFFNDRLSVYPPGHCGFSISKNQYFSFYIGISGFYIPLAISLICGIWSLAALKQNSGLPLLSWRQSFSVGRRKRSRLIGLFEIRSFVPRSGYLPESPPENYYLKYNKGNTRRPSFWGGTIGDPKVIAQIAKDHYPLVVSCLILFILCRSLFYVYFGVGSFIHNFFPLDLSNGVYWLMHSNAAISPLIHFSFDPELRQEVIQMLGIRKPQNSPIVVPIIPPPSPPRLLLKKGTKKNRNHKEFSTTSTSEGIADENDSVVPSISIGNDKVGTVRSLEHFMYLPNRHQNEMAGIHRSPHDGAGLRL